MTITMTIPSAVQHPKHDADYVFYELTRSICPECRRVIDAHILIRDNKVFMRKRCPEHGVFEALVYGDAQAYTSSMKFNKPGTIPLQFTTAIEHGCPYDCGLCPDHQQHTCLGIIEVNSACNMDCPLCFAEAGAGFNLTLAEVENILDHLVETEGHPEVVQFSGGEPSIHPQIIPMMQAANARNIRYVMLNTNGRRIAYDDAFLAQLADSRPAPFVLQATTAGDPVSGRTKYQRPCNGCHGPNGNGDTPLHGPLLNVYYPDDKSLAAIIRNGIGSMPGTGPDKLSDQDMIDVIAFMRALP